MNGKFGEREVDGRFAVSMGANGFLTVTDLIYFSGYHDLAY